LPSLIWELPDIATAIATEGWESRENEGFDSKEFANEVQLVVASLTQVLDAHGVKAPEAVAQLTGVSGVLGTPVAGGRVCAESTTGVLAVQVLKGLV